MKRVGNSRGFTIVETVIFLAVSSGLFVSAMFMMSGQQARTEFHQAVGETQSGLDDVINNVATGYYPKASKLKCDSFFGPSVSNSSVTVDKGTNLDCMFLGQAIQLNTNASGEYKVFTVVGLRLWNGVPSPTLRDAAAGLAIAPGSFDVQKLPAGLTVYKAFAQGTSGKVEISGFAVTSRLSGSSGGTPVTGSTSIDITPITVGAGKDYIAFRDDVNPFLRTTVPPAQNPANGVYVCIDSGGTNQHFILRVGAAGSLSSATTINSGPSSADGDCQP